MCPYATYTYRRRTLPTRPPSPYARLDLAGGYGTDFMKGMGMYYSGWVAKRRRTEDPAAEVPHFLSFESLKPFVDRHLGDLQSIVVKYRTERGNIAHGIKAEIIPKICDVWLDRIHPRYNETMSLNFIEDDDGGGEGGLYEGRDCRCARHDQESRMIAVSCGLRRPCSACHVSGAIVL